MRSTTARVIECHAFSVARCAICAYSWMSWAHSTHVEYSPAREILEHLRREAASHHFDACGVQCTTHPVGKILPVIAANGKVCARGCRYSARRYCARMRVGADMTSVTLLVYFTSDRREVHASSTSCVMLQSKRITVDNDVAVVHSTPR